jgi:hypothetical protein
VGAWALSGGVLVRSAESAVVWAAAPAVAVSSRAKMPVVARVLRGKAVKIIMGVPVL